MQRRTMLVRLTPWIAAVCVASSAACGGGGDDIAPEFLDVAALSGTYQVTLTSEPGTPARTCSRLEITFAAQVTGRGLDCTVRAAGGARSAASGQVTLSETADVAGGGTTSRQAYLFLAFGGTASRPSSGWFGPCSGGTATCSANLRELGSADWVRQ